MYNAVRRWGTVTFLVSLSENGSGWINRVEKKKGNLVFGRLQFPHLDPRPNGVLEHTWSFSRGTQG